jgi:hypothetical protein
MRWFRCAGVLSALLVAGCTTVPPLQVDGVAVGEIVERVKCELAFAVPEPRGKHPTGPYQWMSEWTAKVDLTLVTNSRSQVTPSASFINPLSAGTFTFGIGAGLDTSAERTEALSFSVSLAELREHRRRAHCNLPNGHNLYGNLGLREWIDSALAPVDKGLLKVGRHARLGGKSPPAPPIIREPRAGLRIDDLLAALKIARDRVVHYAKQSDKEYDNALAAGKMEQTQKTYEAARLVLGAEIGARRELKNVDKEAAKVLATDGKLIESDAKLKAEFEAIKKEAKEAAGRTTEASKDVERIVDTLPRDPPIDSLAHSVRFVVAVSGNLSPNWVLARFRGPTAGGSLLSGSHTRTHTLSIALGSPGEQQRVLNNLVIMNLRPGP